MDKSLVKLIQDNEFIFDCRRVIYWPRKKILIAADLHWGKTQYLRQHGIAISDNVFEADLIRLSEAMDDYETSTLLILGDLIHHEKSLSRGVIDKVAHFRHHNACELVLVKGNHDRYTDFPDSWGIVEESDFYIDHFYFTHEQNSKKKDFQFSGHVHPVMRLRSGFDELRLPSFILNEKFCLLPAFSHLTGGQDVRLQKGEEAIVVMNDGIETFVK
jgi:DNA ligase-associated metallophosphoesterase